MKHEKKDFICPTLSTDCPLNQKKFVQKIELGVRPPKRKREKIEENMLKFMINQSELSQTVEEKYKKHIFSKLTNIASIKPLDYGCILLRALFISLSMTLAATFLFGIGKYYCPIFDVSILYPYYLSMPTSPNRSLV